MFSEEENRTMSYAINRKFDHSDFRNSLRRQPDRMTWQRVWLYLPKADDKDAAQIVKDQNPTLSYECEGGDHDDCRSPYCECGHHRALVPKAQFEPLRSCREMASEESEAA